MGRVWSASFLHALEEKVREVKELLANTKASLITDVIETKKNGRLLDQMKSNKDISKDSLDFIDNKKKFDFYKSKFDQAEQLQRELQLKLRDQSEQKRLLEEKINKWKTRKQMNLEPFKQLTRMKEKLTERKDTKELPFNALQHLGELKMNVLFEEEKLKKEKVPAHDQGSQPPVHLEPAPKTRGRREDPEHQSRSSRNGARTPDAAREAAQQTDGTARPKSRPDHRTETNQT